MYCWEDLSTALEMTRGALEMTMGAFDMSLLTT
jgi:hypothetical protein